MSISRWQPIFVVLYLLLAAPVYLFSTPETTRGFDTVAKQFRVVAMRDSRPIGMTLEALRRPDPQLSFLLPAPVVEIGGTGDLHKATVLQSGADWQIVQYEYGNTSSTVSRYRAYRDRIEPLSHRLTFHPGVLIALVVLMVPAWLLSVIIAWLLRRIAPQPAAAAAAPQAPAQAPRLDRFSFYLRWFAVIAVVASFAFPLALQAWEWLTLALWPILAVLCALLLAAGGIRFVAARKGVRIAALKIAGVIFGVGVAALLIAVVSLPAYCDYTPRGKMSEALLAASACRTAVTEIYQAGGKAPAPNAWGCEDSSSRYVTSIATDSDGGITVTIGGGLPSGADGKPGRLTLVPMVGGKPARSADLAKGTIAIDAWRCGHPGDGTTVSPEYLPGSCGGTPPRQGWMNVVTRSNAVSCGKTS